MMSDFLFITELSPSNEWLKSITLAPEGEVKLKQLSKEVKCYAAVGKPFVKEIAEPSHILQENMGMGNIAGQWREMFFFQMATNCTIVPQKGCTVQEARLSIRLHSYHPDKGQSVVVDIQPRQIKHLKNKVTLGLGFEKLFQFGRTAEFDEYEYSLLGVFVMGFSKFHWTFQQVRSSGISGSQNDLVATIARPVDTHTLAHFDLTVNVMTKLGMIPFDTKQAQVVSVDYPLC